MPTPLKVRKWTAYKQMGYDLWNVRDENNLCIAEDVTEEQARLIAAAPALLAALQRAFGLERANHGMTAHAYAYQQAIAHAEGRQ